MRNKYGKLYSTATTQLVSQIMLSDGRTISYEYDAEERITKVIDSVDGTTEYTYDALGQMLTETKNGNPVNTITYDNYGNIVSKNCKTYTYGDSVWKDKLTAYDGQTITYDAQGNPTSYLGHTLTWEKGRQLKSFDGNIYTYNANGIRTSKTVAGVKHEYVLDGTKILRETWGDNVLVPLYDTENSVCGIIYNNVPYYFLKNLQGDVIAIADKNANTVARYTYDAWGVPAATQISSGNIAEINPFRYRSYYYDEEIAMYYLQSRYYDPKVGRFINADDIVATMFSLFVTGMFTYCENNCVNNQDPLGFYKVSIRVRTPNVNSTVAWGFDKNGNFTAGHAFMVLDPEKATHCGGIIRKGFGMADSEGVIKNTLLRLKVDGSIYIEKYFDDYHAQVTYKNITAKQYLTLKKYLNQSYAPKYHIVDYNCVNFVLEGLKKAGINHNFEKGYWDMGALVEAGIVVGTICSLCITDPLLSVGIATLTSYLYSFTQEYGYYPAKLAYDIKNGVK